MHKEKTYMLNITEQSKIIVTEAMDKMSSKLATELVGKELFKASSRGSRGSYSCGKITAAKVNRFTEYGGCFVDFKTDKGRSLIIHSSYITEEDCFYGYFVK